MFLLISKKETKCPDLEKEFCSGFTFTQIFGLRVGFGDFGLLGVKTLDTCW